MADGVEIGKGVIPIQADTRPLEKGVEQAGKTVEKAARNAKGQFVKAGTAPAAVAKQVEQLNRSSLALKTTMAGLGRAALQLRPEAGAPGRRRAPGHGGGSADRWRSSRGVGYFYVGTGPRTVTE
jgi:hypothetical protein